MTSLNDTEIGGKTVSDFLFGSSPGLGECRFVSRRGFFDEFLDIGWPGDYIIISKPSPKNEGGYH